MSAQDILGRWPHIESFLWLEANGSVGDDYPSFSFGAKGIDPVELAASYEEWADFYEWQLTQRAGELATDRVKRHLVEEWTEAMAYSCRRSAAFARGEHPGEWTPLPVRRPDLDAERQAIVAEIMNEMDEQLAMTG